MMTVQPAAGARSKKEPRFRARLLRAERGDQSRGARTQAGTTNVAKLGIGARSCGTCVRSPSCCVRPRATTACIAWSTLRTTSMVRPAQASWAMKVSVTYAGVLKVCQHHAGRMPGWGLEPPDLDAGACEALGPSTTQRAGGAPPRILR
jgi:hypothetical protein